jgi:hypothetical protein
MDVRALMCLLALTLGCGLAPRAEAAAAEPRLQDVGADLSTLKRDFNAGVGNVRMLLILSPGCPGCREGSRVVRESVLHKIDFDHLKVFVVWFPLLDGDSRDLAAGAASWLADPRVSHYWAPDWGLGNAYGRVLDLPKDYDYKVAVDVYLVFDERAEWSNALPRPAAWMHRLGQDERRLDGDKLNAAVDREIRRAVARKACSCDAKDAQ